MDIKIHYGYADTPLGQVHYRETGSGPPVVLLHETAVSGRIYEATLPILGKRVRAIAVDTPGYGASAPPPEPPSIAGYAERLALFLDALGLDRVVLVGNHTGGAIAIQLAVDHPERIPALVVVGCALFSDEERRQRLEPNYLEPFEISLDGSHLSRNWDRNKQILGEDTPLELLHLTMTELVRVGTRYPWGLQAVFKFEGDRLLPKVECPTLFLVTQGDRLRGKNERAVELTPNAEGRVIDRPYQQWPARDPEEFAQEVLTFLGRVNYVT